jgi:flagellar hook-associated protein 1 FlgK
MTDLLSIASSGVSAYRSALTAVADNVANAETPGYSRRSIRMQEAASVGSGKGAGLMLSGVRAAAVDRAWDAFQVAESRLAASVAGRADVRKQWLEKVEGALDHGERSVGKLIGNFYNAGVTLAANPRDRVGRAAMLTALQDVATEVRGTAEALARVSEGIKGSAQLEVDALNSDLEELAKVNLSLRQSQEGRSSFAALEDDRDRLIDRIATRIDVDVAIDEHGMATLTLARSGATTLLDPTSRSLVVVTPAADGRLSLSLLTNGSSSVLPAGGGTLTGLAEVAATVSGQRAQLQSIVGDFVTRVNAWSAAGRDLAGNPGGPMLAMAAGAATLQVTITDPAALAAASATAENGNLLTLPGLRGTDGAEARWTELVAASSQMLSAARSEASAAADRRDNSFAARDEVSGIDLDREAADLMRHQQAYDASARIIQVARETLQSILDLF